MFSTVKLKTLVVFITCTLTVYLCFSVLESKFHNNKLHELQNEWTHYQAYQSERVRLRAHLISALGYGGLIHIYDNYILRKSDKAKKEVWKALGHVEVIINDLKRLSKSEGERASLDDIIVLIEKLSTNLLLIEQSIANGMSTQDIFRAVDNIDFSRADRALDRLGREIQFQSLDKSVNNKFNLTVKIRSMIGMNGMIQSFKNYLLTGNEDEAVAALDSINQIKATIKEYLTFDPVLDEQIAIEDILQTINLYESSIKIIETRMTENASIEDIDKEIVIDDSIALRGFELLESENINEIESKANAVASVIDDMKFDKSIYSVFHFVFFATLIFVLNFMMHAYVIKPIHQVSNALKRLSEGDLEVDIKQKIYLENEIGQLESSFRIFKEHEIERRESEEKLRKLAMTDTLTGLANRTKLEKRYKELVAIAKRKKETIATFMLDLDNFKAVNDTFGHATGDKLLQTVSGILESELRETDIIARIGGDEFVIVLYAPKTEEDINTTAQRLIDKIVKIVPVSGSDIRIGTSIGIVIETDNHHSEDINDVLERADKALYDAKDTGKNKYVYHTDLLKFKNSVRQIG